MTWYLIIPFAFIFLAFILRLPISFGMIGGTIVYFIAKGLSIGTFFNTTLFSMYESYVLIAIPLFMFTANAMNATQTTDKIFNFARALIGRKHGATGYVNILASLIFAGMSGSALADASGLGIIEIEEMKKEGYDAPFACAITGASSVVGPIFPPSIPLIVFGMISGASVGKLLMGGMVPAIILCILMAFYVYFISKKRKYPIGAKVSFKYFVRSSFKALPALFTPVILLIGIYTGIMTPTEAGAIAAAYTLIIALVIYRTLNFKALKKLLISTLEAFGAVFLMVAAARTYIYIVSIEQVDNAILNFVSGFVSSPVVFLIAINIIFLILGCFTDMAIGMYIMVPMILPLVHYFGIDIVHFGVMIVLNMMIGLMTPPFGMLLFVTASVGKIELKEMIRESLPLVGVLIVALVIIAAFPETVLFVTRIMGR